MAALTVGRNVFLLSIKPLLSLQGLYHKLVEAGDAKPSILSEDDYMIFKPGEINVSKWKKLDSRSLGISSKIPHSPYSVLQILRTKGFEAYLVGGCVRDLLLNRTPKDFDVITTAHLDQISKQFNRCEVVGQRFPVCRVYIKGSVVEVSSFDTLAKESEGKEKFLITQMPKSCDKLDLIRWKNSMHRDFTINSLFFDPFAHKIFDYNDGMKDISELKLRTLVPAQLSFTEDSARILRGIRIAARLGLSLSKEIKSAILKQTSSVLRLGQFRTMMEINYMLSYGAAESSLSLLYKYHLLEILLPFQAAYISQQSTKSDQSPMMLMKLLSYLDKLVACDRPSGSPLWIGILAFHMALVNNPQHPFVILTFASILYHQSWKEGLNYARKCGQPQVNFKPETLDTFNFISDEELAKKVNQLAIMVIDSVDALMEKFPDSPCSGFVFVSKNMGQSAQHLFHALAHKLETYNDGRSSFEINFDLLKKGFSLETRFALGKIILNTMGCGVDHEVDHIYNNRHLASSFINDKKQDRKQPPLTFNFNLQQENAFKKQKMITKLSNIMQDKSQGVAKKHTEVVGISSDPKNEEYGTNKSKVGIFKSQMAELISMTECSLDNDKSHNIEERNEVSCNKMVESGTNKQQNDTSKSSMDELICMLESSVDNDNSLPLESQNHEEENTQVKLEESNQNGKLLVAKEVVQNDETGIGSLLQSVKTNFNMAIEEVRNSVNEMRKLNQFLVSFVEKQVERKKEKIDGFQEKSVPLESCSFIKSFNAVYEKKSKKMTEVKLSVKGEKKKQRVCSYCKKAGHNKTGCPQRKIDEAYCQIDTEST